MLTLALIATMQAATPAAASTPTFCERMAQVWPMGRYRGREGLVRHARLKGKDWRQIGYRPDDGAMPVEPAPPEFCQFVKTGHGAVCYVAGPGTFQVRTGRFTRQFRANAGEYAAVETDGRSIACQDRRSQPDYTRFEQLD